jgi:hypothetical protein
MSTEPKPPVAAVVASFSGKPAVKRTMIRKLLNRRPYIVAVQIHISSDF